MMMNDRCGLCGNQLTSIDTMLGANILSDGNILCNMCLDKASDINQDLLNDLQRFNIGQIQNLFQNGKNEQQNISEENIGRDLQTTAHGEPGSLPKELYKKRLKEIKHQLEMLKADLSVFTKGEIKELPHILGIDEEILAITDAQFLNSVDAGILLVTPKRIISVSKAMFAPAKIHDYPNETVLEVSFVDNILSPVIRIQTSDETVEFECFLDKYDAQLFYKFIEQIYNPKKNIQKKLEDAEQVSSKDILNQLEKLAQLRENGILTEEEFILQKQKLLKKL